MEETSSAFFVSIVHPRKTFTKHQCSVRGMEEAAEEDRLSDAEVLAQLTYELKYRG
jgi:hypothetical protein